MKQPKDLPINAVGAMHGTLHNSLRTLRGRLETIGEPSRNARNLFADSWVTVLFERCFCLYIKFQDWFTCFG